MMKYRVETRATVRRVYIVVAKDEKDAEQKSCNIRCDHEEDENEETISILEDDA